MASKLEEVKKLRDQETIILTVGVISYIAQSYPGADPTVAEWNCSKNYTSGATEFIKVHPIFAAPGAAGADIPALFGD